MSIFTYVTSFPGPFSNALIVHISRMGLSKPNFVLFDLLFLKFDLCPSHMRYIKEYKDSLSVTLFISKFLKIKFLFV